MSSSHYVVGEGLETHSAPKNKARSGKLTFAGVICFVVGIPGLVSCLLQYAPLGAGFLVAAMSIVSIAGGICVLRRKQYMLGMVGTIFAAVMLPFLTAVPILWTAEALEWYGDNDPSFIGWILIGAAPGALLGSLATAYVVRSKDEFEPNPQRRGKNDSPT